jgi:hypothetical protein
MQCSVEIRQLGLLHYSIPIVVYERVETVTRLRVFKHHKHKSLFPGKLTVPHLLLLGRNGDKNLRILVGHRFNHFLLQTLSSVMAKANVDHNEYEMVDWRYEKSLLMIHVVKRSLPERM